MKTRLSVVVLAVVLLTAFGGAAQATVIDFDDVVAPDLFAETGALREEYAGLGVHFVGPADKDGAAIVNDSTWGVSAHSGLNILAVNPNAADALLGGGTPQGPETILFDSLMGEVSIYVSGSGNADTFTIEAYDAMNALVDSDTVTTHDWALLGVSSAAGIQRVVLAVPVYEGGSMFDDLSFTELAPAVPAPAGILLGTLGTGLVGWLRRRRSL